ncbi:hypothetical protein I5M99_06185 [Serratia marcescens]|nr:hypothetical protein [Serratia marcescens]
MTDKKQEEVNQANNEYPNYFPENVPPKEAKDAEGEFFRIVKSNPPQQGCFLSMYKEKPNRLKKFSGLKLKCCYGVSVYTEESAVVNAFDKFPEGTGQRYVAKGTVCAENGKMMKTFSDPFHHTLWLKLNSQIHEVFSCTRGLNK